MHKIGFCIAAFVLVLLGCSPRKVRIQGELLWTNERQTLTVCGTSSVYWVRVLASNPYFYVSQRVEALQKNQGGGSVTLLADLEGDLQGVASAGPGYPVDGMLMVHSIHSVEVGACPLVGSVCGSYSRLSPCNVSLRLHRQQSGGDHASGTTGGKSQTTSGV